MRQTEDQKQTNTEDFLSGLRNNKQSGSIKTKHMYEKMYITRAIYNNE